MVFWFGAGERENDTCSARIPRARAKGKARVIPALQRRAGVEDLPPPFNSVLAHAKTGFWLRFGEKARSSDGQILTISLHVKIMSSHLGRAAPGAAKPNKPRVPAAVRHEMADDERKRQEKKEEGGNKKGKKGLQGGESRDEDEDDSRLQVNPPALFRGARLQLLLAERRGLRVCGGHLDTGCLLKAACCESREEGAVGVPCGRREG